MTSSRLGSAASDGVRTTSTSSATIFRPRPLSTTDSPHRVSPGSTPITRIACSNFHFLKILWPEQLFDSVAAGSDCATQDTRRPTHFRVGHVAAPDPANAANLSPRSLQRGRDGRVCVGTWLVVLAAMLFIA